MDPDDVNKDGGNQSEGTGSPNPAEGNGAPPASGLPANSEPGQSGDPSPDDDEFNFIPDDVDDATKAVLEKANSRMKSTFNKKLTEMNEKYKGKKVIDNYDALLKDPDFVEWANGQMKGRQDGNLDPTSFTMDEASQKWSQMNQTQQTQYFSALKPNEREIFKVKLQMSTIAQNTYTERESGFEKNALAEFGDPYKAVTKEVATLRQEIAGNPYLKRDEAFKIIDYKSHGERMFAAGKAEGQNNVKDIKNLPPRSTGSAPTSNRPKASSISEAYEQAESESGKE